MGTTAEKIARAVTTQAKSSVVDLAGHRAARQLLHAARLDGNEVSDFIAQGYDPGHAAYIHAQNLTSIMAEHLSTTREARHYAKVVGDADDTYMPGYPPMSPITASYFTMWACFDVLFGQSHETVGTCLLRFVEASGVSDGLGQVLGAMQDSRMGFYAHDGCEDGQVKLRAIGSQETMRCHVPTGYLGTKGEIWFVRLLPPLDGRSDHHVVFTTPYIVRNVGERNLEAYVTREIARLGSARLPRKMPAAILIMKHGPTVNHWNEYIFCAYAGHQHDAVFLTGIPDIKASLPRA